jgi:hypothetical protein
MGAAVDIPAMTDTAAPPNVSAALIVECEGGGNEVLAEHATRLRYNLLANHLARHYPRTDERAAIETT